MRAMVAEFGQIVTATSAVIMPYLLGLNRGIENLHYEHGHQTEIIETLIAMDGGGRGALKYPLIWLKEDITQNIGLGDARSDTWQPPAIFLFASTKLVQKSADRYAGNITPILIPIYEELLRQIARSRYFYAFSSQSIRHNVRIRPFVGLNELYGTTAHTLEDPLDAIEISNLSLPIRRQPICATNQPFKNF